MVVAYINGMKRFKTGLHKHTGNTTDTKGCDFPYTCLKTYNIIGELIESLYCDDLGYNFKEPTLKELKVKMGKL